MKSVCLILLLVALTSATVEHFRTDSRQVYAYWYKCMDSCTCEWYHVSAYEYTTNNNADTTPPFYFYYYHYLINYCTSTYTSEYIYDTSTDLDLAITRTGRNAELVVDNMTDSAGNLISLEISWPTSDSDNTGNCNCQNFYVIGDESYSFKTKSNYRQANVVGTLTINNVTYQLPTDAIGYIYSYGLKYITIIHK